MILLSLLFVATFGLASCGNTEVPLDEAGQAKKYNMTVSEYKKMKNAAAQMNMTIEDHMKMTDTNGGEMNHDMMDMGDDSSMIEDDMDTMNGMHKNDTVDSHGPEEYGNN